MWAIDGYIESIESSGNVESSFPLLHKELSSSFYTFPENP